MSVGPVGVGAVGAVKTPVVPCKAPAPNRIHMRVKADSGCGEHVLAPDQLPGVPIRVSSESTTTYRTASGKVLQNGGEQVVTGQTTNGDTLTSKWQVVPGIKTPLLSLGKLTGRGHRVILDDDGSFIINKATGKRIELVKKGNTYELDLHIDVPSSPTSPFPRQA